jgi:hypothetical protein
VPVNQNPAVREYEATSVQIHAEQRVAVSLSPRVGAGRLIVQFPYEDEFNDAHLYRGALTQPPPDDEDAFWGSRIPQDSLPTVDAEDGNISIQLGTRHRRFSRLSDGDYTLFVSRYPQTQRLPIRIENGGAVSVDVQLAEVPRL